MTSDVMSRLLQDPGPFASLYVDISREGADGTTMVEQSARNAAEELQRLGAPSEVCTAVREALTRPSHRPAPVSRCLVATRHGIQLDEDAQGRPHQPTVAWDALPDLAGWLTDTADACTFVLALVDHQGGEVATYRSADRHPHRQAEAGSPSPWEHKVRGGAWSHWNLQRSTETKWIRNADEVIAEIGRQLTPEVELIMVGGEPDVRRQVAEADQHWRAEVIELDAARRQAGSESVVDSREIGEVLTGRAVARRLAAVHRFHERVGQGSGSATGIRDVIDALVEGKVQQLLIDPEVAAQHTVTVEDHPGLALGAVQPPGPVRADRVLIALAGLTDAEVVITRSSTLSGATAAAVLRW